MLGDFYRLRAVAAALFLLTAAANSLAAAEQQSLLLSPSLLDYRGTSAKVKTVGYDCPNCPCPSYSEGPAGQQSAAGAAQGASPSYQGLAGQDSEGMNDSFASLGSGGFNINDNPAGYIDNAVVGTWFRVRYDDANDGARPGRAAFYSSYYPLPPGGGSSFLSPYRVDYQFLSTYVELMFFPRLSGFLEITATGVDTTFHPNPGPSGNLIGATTTEAGLGDTIAGIKYQLYQDQDRYLTFQLKTYIPTGDVRLGLGTGHVSIEPGLLYLSRLSQRAYFSGELRYWIPLETHSSVTGDDSRFNSDLINALSGSVLRYGGGIGYDLYRTEQSPLNPYVSNGVRLTGVGELVGWTMLGGNYIVPDSVIYNPVGTATIPLASADGNTVVNMKLGVRGTIGQRSLYVGWGHALTGAPFYTDLFRLEYRRMF